MSQDPPPPPAPGEAVPILPDLLWVRMPLEGPPWHVNCWLLADGPGWLLIDGGISRPEAKAWWDAIFATALGGRPVTRVLVTHFHPDHAGMAGWLCARWRAPLLMTRCEFLQARLLQLEQGSALMEQQLTLARAAAAPAAFLQHLERRRPFYREDVERLPWQHVPLAARQVLEIGGTAWRVQVGHGHAPEMAMLHAPSRGILIAADQVLPRISPYIGVGASEPEADPLGAFLASNRGLLALPADTLCLPSHGEPFRGLHERIAGLEAHHAMRLDRLLGACATPQTAFAATRALFPPDLPIEQLLFVVGEGLAHINRLVAEGRLLRLDDVAGVPRYRRA